MNGLFSILVGFWLGILHVPGTDIPFQFEFSIHAGQPLMILKNGDEKIICDEISLHGDSLLIRLPLYDSEFRCKVETETLSGVWINRGRKTAVTVPFSARQHITWRFPAMEKGVATPPLSSRTWETWFGTGTPDSSLAIGIFKEKHGLVTGTFMTESGDHRYLEGIHDGDSLKLSVFDGAHAWLYLARLNVDTMQGMFYTDNLRKVPFRAYINDSVRLRNADQITQAQGKISFRLPDPDSVIMSLEDERFRNKTIIVQIMGTWCPNCMDESVFLDSVYKARAGEGLEIIGLAFERPSDFRTAAAHVKKLKNRLQLSYPVLIAGVAQKNEVQKVLPVIRDFFSYPTTLFIDRNGNIVKVTSGFSGPATGDYWLRYRENFKKTLDPLLH